jgi:hypothetical protein
VWGGYFWATRYTVLACETFFCANRIAVPTSEGRGRGISSFSTFAAWHTFFSFAYTSLPVFLCAYIRFSVSFVRNLPYVFPYSFLCENNCPVLGVVSYVFSFCVRIFHTVFLCAYFIFCVFCAVFLVFIFLVRFRTVFVCILLYQFSGVYFIFFLWRVRFFCVQIYIFCALRGA